MRGKDFEGWYKTGVKEKSIVESSLFGHAGYFWMSLTQIQLKRMYKLMLEQGAVEKDGGIELKSGLKVNRPDDMK